MLRGPTRESAARGKPPMQTFTDGKKLFAEKNLDEKLAA